ncbi:MAG: homoserine kinase [Clostridiales bacterium]|nr:homoserine kinase [Clostridiales bacterium]
MIKVKVPATSGNVGVGFDILGLALTMYGVFTFTRSESFQITGCAAEYQNEENLVYQSALKAAQVLGKPLPQVKIHIDSPIPLARGLGSSAACVVAGVMGAYELLGIPVNKKEVLAIATDIEGHPDNVAPAIYGGFTASLKLEEEVFSFSYPVDRRIRFLALTPNVKISTKEARTVLPETISFQTAVKNLGKLSIFLKAFETFDQQAIKMALSDELHEPYRKTLIPEYEQVKRLCEKHGNIGFYISGSGSTLMNLITEQTDVRALEKELQQLQNGWVCQTLAIDQEGAKIC